MSDILSQEEETAVRIFIEEVKKSPLHNNGGVMSYNTAVRFMMARKFDVCRAVALFEAHEVTRRREGLVRFDPAVEPLKSELETGKFTVLPVRDSGGAAIAMFTANKHIPTETSHQVTLQGIVYQLDVALDSFETQRCGIVFIYNMTGSKYANFDYELSQKILDLLKGGYPARLKKVLIVAAPLWFKAPFRILQLLIREKIQDRVFMVGIPQLCMHMPITSLPKELGGNFSVDHVSWLQQCLNSTANRYNEISSFTTLTTENGLTIETGSKFENGSVVKNSSTLENDSVLENSFKIENGNPTIKKTPISTAKNTKRLSQHCNNSEENSECHNSINEKQNTEEREKEVEVIKDDIMQVSSENINTGLLTPESAITDFTEEDGEAEKQLSNSSLSLWEDSVHSDTSEGMTMEEFIVHLQTKGRRGLYQEYSEIKSAPPDGTFDISKLKANQSKNRYTDVLCYDHSRVKLMNVANDPNSDYINANYVDGYKQKNAFISSQGPLPKTFPDLWRMVWEQECQVIVMTTKTMERSRVKCGMYWPPEQNTSTEYGNFLVSNVSVEKYADYTISNLVLTNEELGMKQDVCHMQFTSWPDYGVPHSALAMLDFRDKVREKQAQAVLVMDDHWQGHPLGPPILVHCSAGIGRTGTFITLDICINRLEVTGLIEVRKTVEKIRAQRAHSIQMPDQYVFCHLALLEYALSRGLLEDVDLSGFNGDDTDSD